MKPTNIIGLDFSINKPAACIYNNETYNFISWPKNLFETIKSIYVNAGVYIIDRSVFIEDDKDSSKKMRKDLEESIYLSELIVNTLNSFIDLKTCYIVFEGFSFASKGNVILQLSGYKYILMKTFYDKGVHFSNMFTYAPITIKSMAGCAKKGMGKKEMINAFINTDNDISFRKYLNNNKEKFQKKSGNWIDHLDDLIDSYWVIETFNLKSKLIQ